MVVFKYKQDHFSDVSDWSGVFKHFLCAGIRKLTAFRLDSRILIAIGVCYWHLST